MRVALGLVALLATTGPAAAAWAVHCINGRLAVDSRSEAVLRAERGATCTLSPRFALLSDAQAQAQARPGGMGGFCSCR